MLETVILRKKRNAACTVIDGRCVAVVVGEGLGEGGLRSNLEGSPPREGGSPDLGPGQVRMGPSAVRLSDF